MKYTCRSCGETFEPFQVVRTTISEKKGTAICRSCHNKRCLERYYRNKNGEPKQTAEPESRDLEYWFFWSRPQLENYIKYGK